MEHSAILAPAKALEGSGRTQVTYLEPDRTGWIDPQAVLEALRPDTVLVSVQHVNNEVGTIQDIASIGEICKAKGIALHVDAVQSLGYVPLETVMNSADLVTISAHKFYGPKGIGALWVAHALEGRRGQQLAPLLYGGAQERGLRGGTHNTSGAVGMATAAEIAHAMQPAESTRLEGLRDFFSAKLL